MKKIIILAIAMLAMAQAGNASERTDTLDNSVRKVIDCVSVNESHEWEITSLKDDESKPGKFSVVLNGLYLGLGTHNTLDIINNSFEYGILNVAAFEYNTDKGQLLSVGVGFGGKRFSLKRPYMFQREDDGHALNVTTYPQDAVKRNSRLYVHTMHFPLLLRQELFKNWHITVGGIINWNYRVDATNHYKLYNTNYDISQHSLKQNKCTFDWIAGVDFKGIGLYCRYCPAKVLKNNYGPRIHDTWSMGITLGM